MQEAIEKQMPLGALTDRPEWTYVLHSLTAAGVRKDILQNLQKLVELARQPRAQTQPRLQASTGGVR